LKSNWAISSAIECSENQEKAMKHLSSPCAIGILLASSMLCGAQNTTSAEMNALAAAPQADGNGSARRPNILFIIMDDVGIDQMRIFGYGGLTPPSTPNIDAVARAGVRFRNVWSMPECSPSRAIFFEGRFPLRTKVYNAILDDDLANSQVSPFEATTPKLLRRRNYDSAMFGKFHLAGPNYNPFGNATPHALGWNYFDGFVEGAPHPIDTTAGGVAPAGTYTCGFVPNANFPNGSDAGACYSVNNSCTVMSKTAVHATPGKVCVEAGGVFVPNQVCQSAAPSNVNFNAANGYYVWNRVIIDPSGTVTVFPYTDQRSRGYVSVATTSAAVDWINAERSSGKRWMATVSFANAHTPYQQPPNTLLPPASELTNGFKCTGNDPANQIATRVLSNQMIESMDKEIGQILVETGLATANSDGSLQYDPATTDTMVLIIGDNGTFAPGVKAPFDKNRAKGSVYQTGVWVPLIVSGPLVNSPDREVTSMVNIADLFQLFGEIAGVDVQKAVPKSHILDSASMLPYLTNPDQASIRQTNFTQTASNIHVNNQQPPPCVIPLTSPPTCVQVFNDQGVCEYEGGIWYGPGAPVQYPTCCAVKNAGIYDSTGLQILANAETSTRNQIYKLVTKQVPDCSSPSAPDMTTNEFYEINEAVPIPKIDKDGDNLCSAAGCPTGLDATQLANYNQLQSILQSTLSSEPACPGDGNEDKRVNGKDIVDWSLFRQQNPENPGFSSSWYDFNFDGLTDGTDLKVILANFGKNCLKPQ
jgi:Sulfatase